MKTMKEQLLDLVQETGKIKAFYFEPAAQCKEKILNNAIRSFAKECAKEDVVALLDVSAFRSGKNGYLLTEDALYSDHFIKNELPGKALRFEEITAVHMGKKSHLCLTMKDGMQKEVYTGIFAEDLAPFLQKILTLRNAQSQASPAPKENAKPESTPASEPKLRSGATVNNEELLGQAMDLFNDGDQKAAFDIWLSLAQKGNANAQNCVAVSYQKGEGVEKDIKKAVFWFEKSASQGYGKACGNLARHYYDGDGVEQNYEKAVELYKQAAKQGARVSQYRLGCCYYFGKGVTQDYEKARIWFHAAAEAGHIRAAFYYANLCELGYGGKKELSEAAKWYQIAAENGDEDAKKICNKIRTTPESVNKPQVKVVTKPEPESEPKPKQPESKSGPKPKQPEFKLEPKPEPQLAPEVKVQAEAPTKAGKKYIDDRLAKELQEIAAEHGFEIVPDSPEPDMQKKLKKAFAQDWAPLDSHEKVLAVKWMGMFANGKKGIILTNAGLYGPEADTGLDRLPFEGLCGIDPERDFLTAHALYVHAPKSVLIWPWNNVNEAKKLIRLYVDILKPVIASNEDLKKALEQEMRQKYRAITDYDFLRYIYRFKDIEFAVLNNYYDTEGIGRHLCHFRDIHTGRQGEFAVYDENHKDYGKRRLAFKSYESFSWMKRVYSSLIQDHWYVYSEEREGKVYFEIIGQIERFRYGSGEAYNEEKSYPFSSDKGTQNELKKLKPGDTIYAYIDESKKAHIVYSVHTGLYWRRRLRRIDELDVDRFYHEAFDGYNIKEYEWANPLDKREDRMKWYLI